MGVRAQPGSAYHGRTDRDPGAAGKALVGDPAAVRLAPGRQACAVDRAARGPAAGRLRAVRVRHRRAQHPGVLPVALRVRPRSLLRRLDLHLGAGAALLHEAADGQARLPRPRGAAAAEGRPRAHPARALRAGRAGRVVAGVADDQPPWPAGLGRRRLAGAADRQPRRIGRRAAAPDRAAGAARARVGHRAQRLPGQQDRRLRRRHQAGQRSRAGG